MSAGNLADLTICYIRYFTTEKEINMKKHRLWALSLRRLSIFLVISFGLSVGFPAGAQETSSLPLWEYPGIAKFKGTPEEACEIWNKKGFMSLSACQQAVSVFQENLSCETYYLEDGDVVVTTFTKRDGSHDAKKMIVAFKYPAGHAQAGESLPANDQKRLVVSCHLGIGDSKAIALPFVCGNWTIHNREVEPVAYVSPPREHMMQHTGVIPSGSIQYLPSVSLPGCGIDIPSAIIVNSDTLQSRGATRVDW